MGRKNWEQMGQEEAFVAVSNAPRPSRVWPILGGLLLLGSAGFVVSYYLPLYRAHETLNVAYVKLANTGREQQEQFTQTVAALKRTAAERDELKAEQGGQRLSGEAAKKALSNLEKELQSELGTFIDKKLVTLQASEQSIEVQFQSPTLFKNDSAAATPAGKALICSVAKAAGKSAIQFAVLGSATPSDAKQRTLKVFPSAWHLSVARGAGAAQALAESCKVPVSSIVASGVPGTDAEPLPILTLKLSP